MDRWGSLLAGLVPSGFLLLGIALLAPAFVGGAPGVGPLAVSLGGLLFAARALSRLPWGFAELATAAIAWDSAAPLLSAAAREPTAAHPDAVAASIGDEIVVDASALEYRRPGRAAPVLADVGLRIRAGDRVLLEGPSGSGKSTLAAILAGLREAHAGLLLVGGLDPRTLGPRGFRRRVAAAPQFHDNHVLSAPLAFNLLMGRAWPPSAEDLRLAEEVCRDLDLGPLLERMPGGLFQMVGDTGWQLSHGERSRLFIARALLQGADLLVLDESFGALDPETLRNVMACVLRRAKTILVIAHP
jgi:ATP-binding cassette subfamily B protein